MIRSASVTGAWHRSPRGRYRGCSSFRRVKTQEGFDAFTHRSPPAGEIEACHSRPAVCRWHINGLARISARLVGRTEVACGDELQRQLFGRPVRKTPQWLSALRNPLLPATLRAPEAPPPCEPKKPPEHTLEGFLWYGHTGTIPAAIGCGAVVRKGSVRNLCTLPAFYICFWQLYPALHRRTSETRLPKRVLSEASVKAVFLGGAPICKRGSAANAPAAGRVQRLGKPTECKARYGCLVFLRPESRLQIRTRLRRFCASSCRPAQSGGRSARRCIRCNPCCCTPRPPPCIRHGWQAAALEAGRAG